MDKALWSQSTIGFMALELWSQDYFKRPFLEYVKIQTFLFRFFTLKKLLNDILKKVVKYETSFDQLIFDKHIILVGKPTCCSRSKRIWRVSRILTIFYF